MRRRVVVGLVAVGLAVMAACSDDGDTADRTSAPTTDAATTDPSTSPATTDPPATDPPSTPPTTEATTTTSSTSTTSTTTTTVPPTSEATTTTTAPAPVPGQPNPACIVVVAPGDSLFAIAAARNDPAVTVEAVALENGISDVNSINAGQSLDVCPGNGIDDLTGAPRVPDTAPPPPETAPAPTPPPPVEGLASGVAAQQQKLNELFGPYGMRSLTVDGVSGRMTRQLLCAARLSLGMPVSREEMVPGSQEEQSLMAATSLQIPPGAPVHADRWALVDQHCQVMFTGERSDRLVFVFPTSTGSDEFPTRNQQASRAFRYDPAPENGGWHDSSDYPASVDNPLNGNMYKPVYFDGGQAIHGANTVPTSPASHGCARLRIADQDALVAWLGLQDVTRQLWDSAGRINLTVTVVGHY